MTKKKLKEIIFVTGNKYKFQVAEKAMQKHAIKLTQKKLETPEIQAESVEDVAAFSAMWAADVLKKPVVVSDGGCYIDALNGFPGPFIKYINNWLTANDLLNVMKDKANRNVVWKDCLVYCEPGEKPKTFVSYFEGTIARKVGKVIYRKEYGWMDSLFIPEGHVKTLSELPTEEYLNYWANPKNYNSWKRLVRYLK